MRRHIFGIKKEESLLRTEGSSNNFISVWIIKGNSVYDVSVAFQRQQLVA